jgi:hypothetical protein
MFYNFVCGIDLVPSEGCNQIMCPELHWTCLIMPFLQTPDQQLPLIINMRLLVHERNYIFVGFNAHLSKSVFGEVTYFSVGHT